MEFLKREFELIPIREAEAKTLLAEILNHAEDTSRRFTLEDLKAYEARWLNLSRKRGFESAMYECHLQDRVNELSLLMTALEDTMEYLGMFELSPRLRQSIVRKDGEYIQKEAGGDFTTITDESVPVHTRSSLLHVETPVSI